jgi:hypothetical protein
MLKIRKWQWWWGRYGYNKKWLRRGWLEGYRRRKEI